MQNEFNFDAIIGIHFGFDEEEYHAVPAFSQSLLKNYRISMLQGWWNTPWLNAAYEAMHEKKQSKQMDFGKAMHAYLLEGETFFDRYAVSLDQADYSDALNTADEIKEFMRNNEIKPLTGKKDDLMQRIRDNGFDDTVVQFWDDIVSAYAKENAGRQFVSSKELQTMKFGAKMVGIQKKAAEKFTDDGHSEVSIFWRDRKTGLPMKTRIDRLELQHTLDLKTFSNQYMRRFDKAVNKAIESSTYHFQAIMNISGVNEAIKLYTADRKYIHGLKEINDDWFNALATEKDRRYFFLFMQSELPCEIRVKEFIRHAPHSPAHEQLCYMDARDTIRSLLESIAKYMKAYPNDAWVSDDIESEILDEDIPYLTSN